MSKGNYFAALVGLSLDSDSPSTSPTAAVAQQQQQQQERADGSQAKGSSQSRAGVAASRAAAAAAAVATTTGAATPAANGSQAGGAGDQLQPKPARPKLQEPLVWVDLEMTGLDIGKDTIIEIAVLVTDGELRQVVEGPEIAIHHPEAVLANMNDWCKEHHAKSGLVQRVRESVTSLAEAEEQVLAFVQQHTPYQTAQLAGNSVHVDRLFLQRHMPRLLEHLHYRIVDVSTFKECCRRWKPKLARQAPRKVAAHTAMSDIRESLRELQYYKAVLFKATK